MMMTFDSKDNFRDLIAAVHNADLTCRAQILEPDQNPEMHRILAAFAQKTGRGVILNTSFNLHGYPIVRTAEHALHAFRNSGLRYLPVGNYLVSKSADVFPRPVPKSLATAVN
jgi:carbamoyltransferase